ncbi:TadE/TadG family type IV pilus assembly protein [Sinorhizobium fredii]|uniref:TadE/TadG family type IV pilus assembly protein n=1 Tax=Rhizobium fredii TaxID=380 RepID=UPI0035143F43
MNGFKNFLGRPRCFAFWLNAEGAVLAEALIAVPFITIFAAGILEFGNIFWERMQIDAGLRDAGRYLSRCRPTSPTYTSTCSEATAKLIAFYGTQSPAANATLRVPGWGPTLADITVNAVGVDGTFTIETAHLYEASPIFAWLGIEDITISASHEERYMGW